MAEDHPAGETRHGVNPVGTPTRYGMTHATIPRPAISRRNGATAFSAEPEQSQFLRSAVRNPIARLRFRSLTQRIGVFGATLLAENTGPIALIRATSWPFAWTYKAPN